MFWLSFPIGLIVPLAICFVIFALLRKLRIVAEDPNERFLLFVYAFCAVPWLIGASEGASAFSAFEGGGLFAVLGLVLFEMFWHPVTITEGLETLLFGGLNINDYEPQ